MEKSTKIIIGVLAGLCVLLFAVTIFAKNWNFEGYKDENGWLHKDDTSVMYETDTNVRNKYALVPISKETLTDIDSHTYIELISPVLNGYSNKIYTSFKFEDGTGIYYPGSNINQIAIYGEMNENGLVTQELGLIETNGTIVSYTESAPIQSVETKNMYQYLPSKYQTDNGSVLVIDGNLFISVGIETRANETEAYVAADEVYKAFLDADLSQYNNIEIVVNNEFAYVIVNETLVLKETVIINNETLSNDTEQEN